MKDFQTADLCDAYPDVASCTVDFKQYGFAKNSTAEFVPFPVI